MNFKIGDKNIGNGQACFIVAELSANHNQDIEIAIKTIKAAKEAGADAIKLQHYTPDTLTIDSQKEYFQIKQGTLWDGTTLYDLYKEAYMPWEWTAKLQQVAKDEGLICFSSPFDKSAVDFLEAHNMPAYKIASFEINDIPLIEYVASKGKPVILSTGIAHLSDIELAIDTIHKTGNNQIALLKCTSTYPASLDDINLLTIPNLIETFGVTVGLSDHTFGISVPSAAVTLGAKIVEKHLILDRSLGGPDSSFSLNVEEFKQMAATIRDVEKALGSISYELSPKVEKNRELFSRSLFVVDEVKKGEVFSEKNVRSIRPGFGLHTRYYNQILGKKAKSDIERGTPMNWDLIE